MAGENARLGPGCLCGFMEFCDNCNPLNWPVYRPENVEEYGEVWCELSAVDVDEHYKYIHETMEKLGRQSALRFRELLDSECDDK